MKSFSEPPETNQDRTNPYKPTLHTVWELLLRLPIPKHSALFIHSLQDFSSFFFIAKKSSASV